MIEIFHCLDISVSLHLLGSPCYIKNVHNVSCWGMMRMGPNLWKYMWGCRSRCQVMGVVALRGRRLHKVPRQQFAATLRWCLISPLWCMWQARVCRNLRYSLAHLKSRDKQTYLAILDSIVMGPSHISATEAEALLNINSYLFKWVTLELKSESGAIGRALLGEQN